VELAAPIALMVISFWLDAGVVGDERAERSYENFFTRNNADAIQRCLHLRCE
jgi:hypothetical protein